MSENSLVLPQDEESKQINTYKQKADTEDTIEGARNVEIGVYWQRWYILTITILSTVCMTAVWNTWGPIAQSAKAAYGWSDTTITVLQNCGNGGTLVALLPMAFIIGRAGISLCNHCYGVHWLHNQLVNSADPDETGAVSSGFSLFTGTHWMTYAVCGVQAVCIPALVLFKQRYTRLDVNINISVGNKQT